MTTKRWSDVNAIYQIYPRSFQDASGDGIGDLPGIISRLDYLAGQADSLGVDAIWLSPVYKSPMADMGYDVSDFRDIDPLFGDMDDFKQLIAHAHQLGVKVMIDFVPNHSSDQHPWFQGAKKSRDSEFSDYYIWHDGGPKGELPNNWQSIFGGPAWTWNEARKQYYLHTFLPEQPDLNWANPKVRAEMKAILKFWLDIGVDGFRADAVRFISKDPKFRDNQESDDAHHDSDSFALASGKNSEFGPELFGYLTELVQVLNDYDDRIMLFEDYVNHHYQAARQITPYYQLNSGKTMPFNFGGIGLEFTADNFREFLTRDMAIITSAGGLPVLTFGNHDQHRMVARYGGEDKARMAALLQLTIPGLPVVYYGDELGMPNTPIREDQIQDKGAYQYGDANMGRDPARTPMQWDDSEFTGFSTVEPWLPVGPTAHYHSVAAEQTEPDSFLSLYRRLLHLRAEIDTLRNGKFQLAENDNDHELFSYLVTGDGGNFRVIMNFGSDDRTVQLSPGSHVLCCSHPVDYPEISSEGQLVVRGLEAVLIIEA